MAKRKEEAPPPGAPAWQSTFADLMNLLLCFFVLLFSMSSIDVAKFQMIAASFSSTFSIFNGGATSFEEGMLLNNGISQFEDLDSFIESTGRMAENDDLAQDVDEMQHEMEQKQLEASEALAEKISEALAESQLSNDVELNFTSQYVQLTLKGSILFDSGKAELREDAMPMVSKVAMIIERYADNTIEVEGHTDNVPMHSSKYENNDVLSSYRALAMFNYLVENTSISPENIKHSGRGEYIPVADNSTPEGRAKNRRIEIKIYNALSAE